MILGVCYSINMIPSVSKILTSFTGLIFANFSSDFSLYQKSSSRVQTSKLAQK